MKILSIPPAQTLQIRHLVLWPDMPMEFVSVEGDDGAEHLGLFIDDQLVSVISLFYEENQLQFRKFATLPDHQGKGYGSALLRHVLKNAEPRVSKVWCWAREEKVPFYQQFGMIPAGETTLRNGKPYRKMTRIF